MRICSQEICITEPVLLLLERSLVIVDSTSRSLEGKSTSPIVGFGRNYANTVTIGLQQLTLLDNTLITS